MVNALEAANKKEPKEIKEIKETVVIHEPQKTIVETVNIVDDESIRRISSLEKQLEELKSQLLQKDAKDIEENEKRKQEIQKIASEKDESKDPQYISILNQFTGEIEGINGRISEISGRLSILTERVNLESEVPKKINNGDDSLKQFFEQEVKSLEKQMLKEQQELAEKIHEVEQSLGKQVSQVNRELSKMKSTYQGGSFHDGEVKDGISYDRLKEEMDIISAEIERNLNKKIFILEGRVREFDDLRKHDKVLTKIQIEMNSKLSKDIFDAEMGTKLSRNEFFDFINKNLVSKDEIKSIDIKVDKFGVDLNEKITVVDAYTRKHKRTLYKKCEDIEKKIEEVRKSSEEAYLMIGEGKLSSEQIEKRTSLVEKKFVDLKKHMEEAFTARLRCLATTKTVNCLSCGKKDINYPPITELIKGDTNYYYEKDQNENYNPNVDKNANNDRQISDQMKPFSISQDTMSKTAMPMKTSNLFMGKPDENRIFSASSNLKSRLPSAQMKLGVFPKRQYSAAEQLITRECIVKEHTEALHDDHSRKARPFSSVPQKVMFKIT